MRNINVKTIALGTYPIIITIKGFEDAGSNVKKSKSVFSIIRSPIK
nr:hypothetical protein [Aliarcobacter butzleri]